MTIAARRASRVGAILAAPRPRRVARALVGAAVLVAVVARVGAEPFLHGLRSVEPRTVAAAFALSAVATIAGAWRWRVVAAGLGAHLSGPAAIGASYRSQFLNTVLPGGVVGDVQRAVVHGRRSGAPAQAARAVVIERSVGQLVQCGLAVVVLAAFAPRFAGPPLLALGIGAGALALAAAAAAAASVRVRRALRRELDGLRAVVGSPGPLLRVVLASVVVTACHAATFGIAAAAVGAEVPPTRLAAIALVVLLGAAVPLSLGGWGPREGIAGWTFAAAGLGADTGVAASTLFGILTTIAVLPGLLLVAFDAIRLRRRPSARAVARGSRKEGP